MSKRVILRGESHASLDKEYYCNYYMDYEVKEGPKKVFTLFKGFHYKMVLIKRGKG
jgi:hypothetical protein